MALTWLTYNGSTVGLTSHAGYGLGFDSTPQPTPSPLTSGNLRFRFDDKTKTVSDLYADIFDSSNCTVVQVLDANTGLPIPGLFDVAPGPSCYSAGRMYKTGPGTGEALSVANCGGRVDLVDAYVSGRSSGWWNDAFTNSTAIRDITITHYVSLLNQEFTSFVTSSAVDNIDFDYEGNGGIWTGSTGQATLDTLTIRNFTGFIQNGSMFSNLDVDTFNLYPYYSQPVFYQPVAMRWPKKINVYTKQSAGTSYAFVDTQYQSYTFRNSGLEELHAYAVDGTEIDLKLRSDCTEMFSGCSITDLTTFHFDCTDLTNADRMFFNCQLVETGIVDTYNVLSAKLTGGSGHSLTFHNCGIATSGGTAELAQIPADWK